MGLENENSSRVGSADCLELIKTTFPDAILGASSSPDAVVVVRKEAVKEVLSFLESDPQLQFNVLMDLTAVDYLGREPRFEVVYTLVSLPFTLRLQVKAPVSDKDPVVDSATGIWDAANWLEREVWDMFGIRFAGHPNLKRILMYEEFQGHALRKDYPIRKRQPLIGPQN
jgi:NADH-quinone oxidoreductase subunit C